MPADPRAGEGANSDPRRWLMAISARDAKTVKVNGTRLPWREAARSRSTVVAAEQEPLWAPMRRRAAVFRAAATPERAGFLGADDAGWPAQLWRISGDPVRVQDSMAEKFHWNPWRKPDKVTNRDLALCDAVTFVEELPIAAAFGEEGESVVELLNNVAEWDAARAKANVVTGKTIAYYNRYRTALPLLQRIRRLMQRHPSPGPMDAALEAYADATIEMIRLNKRVGMQTQCWAASRFAKNLLARKIGGHAKLTWSDPPVAELAEATVLRRYLPESIFNLVHDWGMGTTEPLSRS
jgi:hypothetical protein